jgi:glycosyltransferase involved in cell wall biosynthesis
MKILIVTQYFWPENFRINDLVEGFASYGHEVTILTGIPNYPRGKVFPEFLSEPNLFNEFGSSRVIRVPIIPRGKNKLTLALNYLSYVISSIIIGSWKLKGDEFDVIFVYEPSPITVGLPAIWLKKLKKAPVIFWTLDLWPEALSSFGIVKSKSILSFVGKIVGFIYNRCDLILAQSYSFIDPISKYCKDNVSIEYFPSWSEELLTSNEMASEVEFKSNTFNILFTGNIGEAQDFPAIIDAAECLRNENVRWLIAGDGRMSDWLNDEIIDRGLESKIILLGEFPIERMTSFYNHSQALLLPLKRDYFLSLVIPGKVQSYLMSGLPILGMVQGEAEQIIKKSGCGYTCESGDGIALAAIVKKMILTSDADRVSMGAMGRNYAIQEFDRKMLFKKLESWMFEYANNYNSKIK